MLRHLSGRDDISRMMYKIFRSVAHGLPGDPAIEADESPLSACGQTEKIDIRHLPRSRDQISLEKRIVCYGNVVRPELVGTRKLRLQRGKNLDYLPRAALSTRIGRLGKYPDHSVFGERARGPSGTVMPPEPLLHSLMMYMIGIHQSDQSIHVEKGEHPLTVGFQKVFNRLRRNRFGSRLPGEGWNRPASLGNSAHGL